VLKRFRQNWQNVLIGFLLTGIFALGFFVSYLGLKLSKVRIPLPTSGGFSNATPAPINEVVKEEGVYNILFLGYGGAGHSGGTLTDSIIVIHINTNTHESALISIPRDLWVPGNHKINAAGIEGFQNVPGVIQNVTGLPVNYFVSVDFGGFVKLIDNLGKINVNVPQTFDDQFYPVAGLENEGCGFTGEEINAFKAKYSGFELEKQFTCRYEHLHFDKGPTTLDGTTALKFVRSRHGDSDFGRSARQFAVLIGIGDKLISIQSAGKLNSTIDILLKIVRTDLNAGVIKTLIQVFGDPTLYKTKQVQLSTENVLNSSTSSDRQFILIPKAGNFNFAQIKSYVKSQL
jgi:LCP family protein required for cell wall assembly